MVMKRVGAWLAIFAIALQAALPLIASAQSRAVTLVPLCTVDGVTHYVEVPTGKTPAGPPAHGDHCALCFVGDKVAPPTQLELLTLADTEAQVSPPRDAAVVASNDFQTGAARAPPASPVVISLSDNFGRQGEQATGIRRAGLGATHGERFLRLGLLHDQH